MTKIFSLYAKGREATELVGTGTLEQMEKLLKKIEDGEMRAFAYAPKRSEPIRDDDGEIVGWTEKKVVQFNHPHEDVTHFVLTQTTVDEDGVALLVRNHKVVRLQDMAWAA